MFDLLERLPGFAMCSSSKISNDSETSSMGTFLFKVFLITWKDLRFNLALLLSSGWGFWAFFGIACDAMDTGVPCRNVTDLNLCK